MGARSAFAAASFAALLVSMLPTRAHTADGQDGRSSPRPKELVAALGGSVVREAPATIAAFQDVGTPQRVSAERSRAGGSLTFAFGYVEFDWAPDVPPGVPGFDGWASVAGLINQQSSK